MMKSSISASILILVRIFSPSWAFGGVYVSTNGKINRQSSTFSVLPKPLKTSARSLLWPCNTQSMDPQVYHVLHMSGAEDEASSASDGDKGEPGNQVAKEEEATGMKRLRQRLFPPKKDADGLTTRQRLAKMGLSVLLSYGWVSNMSYSITISLAWFIFSKQTGLSPLAKGQWKPFLGVYAGFYIFNNFIRPFRIGLSVAVARYFDNIVKVFQDKFKVSKGLAIGITVFFANIVGTLAAMSAGIALASLASGVPIFP